MATTLGWVFCCLVLILPGTVQVQGLLTDYYMNEHCGKTFDLSAMSSVKAINLQMRSFSQGFVPSCRLKIRAPFGHSLLFSLNYLEFSGGIPCDNEFFRIYDGLDDGASSSLVSSMCGKMDGKKVTTGRDAYLIFRTSDRALLDTFSITVTAFTTGVCRASGEFKCTNGRCIDVALKCSTYDNCGDGSNNECNVTPYEPGPLDYLWWLWVLIGVFLFLVIVSVIIAVVCCVCLKKGRSGTVVRTPPAAYNAGAGVATVTGNPWFATPAQNQNSAYSLGTTGTTGTAYPGPQAPQTTVAALPPSYPATTEAPPYTEKTTL